MIGSEGVARGLMNLLRDNMVKKLSDMRTRLTAELADPVTERELPDIQRWAAHDLDELEVGGFPAALIMEVESTGKVANQTQEVGATYDEYTFEYVMRVYLWAMGDSAGDTALRMKRLVQAVEEICLGRKVIFRSETEQAGVDPTSIRHSYSDAAIDDAQQVLTAGYVELRVRTVERVDTIIPPYATDVDGAPVPPVIDVAVRLGIDLDTGLL